jgi:hypothetical protein
MVKALTGVTYSQSSRFIIGSLIRKDINKEELPGKLAVDGFHLIILVDNKVCH